MIFILMQEWKSKIVISLAYFKATSLLFALHRTD